MFIHLDRTGSAERLGTALAEISVRSDVQSILILACDENGLTPEAVNGFLAAAPIPVFGGVFPAIIHGEEKLSQGFIVAGLPNRAEVQVVPRLSDADVEYEEFIDDSVVTGAAKTMVVFVDGLAKRISTLIDCLFNVFGLEFNYVGGGAGSLSFRQKPCLFTNEGLVQDSAVLALLEMNSGVGVCHGWNEVDGPFQVTESDRNVIQTLDWRPAFDVYREVVERNSGRSFDQSNFFDLAKSYPFGISKLGAEKVVRDPLTVQADGTLVCVGEIPRNSSVHVLTGDLDSLVQAAGMALNFSEESFVGQDGKRTAFFVDCVSRAMFLENQFIRELQAVHRSDTPLIGALTLGEIANSRKDYLEFYNKTAVVGMLES